MKLQDTVRFLSAKGNWNIAKGKAKQLLARWANDDLQFVEGKADELVGRVQRRAAAARRHLEREARFTQDSWGGHR